MNEQAHLPNEQLHGYLDGALTPAERAACRTHLAGCPSCQARLARLQQLFDTLSTLSERPLTRDLLPGVLAAIAPQVAAPRLRLLLALQGVAILLVLVWASQLGLAAELLLFGDSLRAGWASQTAELAAGWAMLVQGLPPLLASLPYAAGGVLLWLVGNGLLLRGLLPPPHTKERL